MHREGSCSKRPGVLSKVQTLNLVLGVGGSLPFLQNPRFTAYEAFRSYAIILSGEGRVSMLSEVLKGYPARAPMRNDSIAHLIQDLIVGAYPTVRRYGKWENRALGTQMALRDILMPRGKNRLPNVSRQFSTLNYPRPNCLLRCLPNCLSPRLEDMFLLFQNCPRSEGNCAAIERQKLSRGNFCRSAAAQLPSPRGQFWKSKNCPLLWGRGTLGGILRDNLGEGIWESKIVARQWGVDFCREASRCLAGPSG